MFDDTNLITTLAIVALVIAFFAVVIFISKRIRRVPPNEALVIVGRGAGRKEAGGSGQKVVVGGRTFVWPILQQGFSISLEQRQIGITVEGVDKNRIKIAIKASINFKVQGDEEGVRRAAQRFLSQQGTLTEIIKESLEGSLRSIVGDMTIEQIISDRKGLSDRVVESTKADLSEQGLQVDLLNISDISTPGSDYLANLGRAESARARQVAEVSEAEAQRALGVRRHRGGRADRQAPEGPRPQARRDQGRHRPRQRRGRGLGPARARRAGPPRRAAGARGARRAGARDAGAPRHRGPQARRGQGVRGGPGGQRAS